MKNPFSRKKDKFPKAQAPRELKDIQAEYNNLSLKAGQNQYQVYVLKQDLEYMNRQLVNINQEAAERQKLDKAAAELKAKEAKKEESK